MAKAAPAHWGGQPLTIALTLADITTLTNGRTNMPAFGSVMPQNDLQDVATYLVNELIPANAQ